ncbi:hypothetical protein TRVL_09828 [Trypanosoma vivax]|nr:hypothetical protein TRVL_09828 [Trypanosoma vivax]
MAPPPSPPPSLLAHFHFQVENRAMLFAFGVLCPSRKRAQNVHTRTAAKNIVPTRHTSMSHALGDWDAPLFDTPSSASTISFSTSRGRISSISDDSSLPPPPHPHL